ncbi:phospholipase D-like domain-containing protein [Pendulispora rubella]|uniref:phospholipase D n=1 Tax=Pendulispora rubella TaxID=2741070 RepID=A0ABZ2KUQ8_9BACT
MAATKIKEFEDRLRETLADGRLSRGERKMLDETLRESEFCCSELALLRGRAFTIAKSQLSDPHARRMVEWLEEVMGLLADDTFRAQARRHKQLSDAFFSPGNQCLGAVLSGFKNARAKVDVCVFTITDDRIAETILSAHRRGTLIRIVTDNDKACDEGSDVARLQQAGIPVRVDRTEFHMHHKFALFDDESLLNGSYNWTRTASSKNDENLVMTRDSYLVQKFSAHFEKLWSKLA